MFCGRDLATCKEQQCFTRPRLRSDSTAIQQCRWVRPAGSGSTHSAVDQHVGIPWDALSVARLTTWCNPVESRT